MGKIDNNPIPQAPTPQEPSPNASVANKVAKFVLKVGVFLLFPVTLPIKLFANVSYISALRPTSVSYGSAVVKQEVLGGKLDRLGTSITKVFAKIFSHKGLLKEIERKQALFSILDAADKTPGLKSLIQEPVSRLFYLAGSYKMKGDMQEVFHELVTIPGFNELLMHNKEAFKALLGACADQFHDIIDPYGPVP